MMMGPDGMTGALGMVWTGVFGLLFVVSAVLAIAALFKYLRR